MTTYQKAAEELSEAFTTIHRDGSDEHIYVLKDEVKRGDGWINSELILRFHEVLDNRLPDDWVYEIIAHGADSLEYYETADEARDAVHEIADGLVDIYNSNALRWLASHQLNAFLCDDAADEFGRAKDTIQHVQQGQYLAITRILAAMVEAIEEEASGRDEGKDDEDEA